MNGEIIKKLIGSSSKEDVNVALQLISKSSWDELKYELSESGSSYHNHFHIPLNQVNWDMGRRRKYWFSDFVVTLGPKSVAIARREKYIFQI